MRDLDTLIRAFIARERIPGLSVGIAREGTLLHAAGYGFANLELQVRATERTIYQIASVGKQFTSALIMLLVERGSLKLEDTLARYFDPAPNSWKKVTIRHLLTHTAGISDAGYAKLNLRLDYTDAQLLGAIAKAPLEFEPGAAWSYSNCGYILLGLLAAVITGRFYVDLLTEWIFTPLQMTTARVISEEDIIPNRAAGYRLDGTALCNQEYVSPSLNRTADGGLYMSVLDLAEWDRALHHGTLLSPASRDAMWTPVTLSSGVTCPYGFGWSVESTPHGRLVEHDGEWQGFSTHIVRYLDEGLSIMVLSNLADATVSELSYAIAAQGRAVGGA